MNEDTGQLTAEPTVACFPISCKSRLARTLECSVRISAVGIR